MRVRRMRKVAAALAVTLFAGVFIVTAPSPASACGRAVTRQQVFRNMKTGSVESVTLRTLNLDVTPPKAGKVGSTVTIEVVVTRPAKEDPFGQGIPMDRPYVEPAPGVIVGIGLSVGNVFLPGAALTDEDGLAVVKIKLETWTPRNAWVNMSVYAWRVVQETACLTVQEDGYLTEQRVFKTS